MHAAMLIHAHGLFGSHSRNVIAPPSAIVRFGEFTLDRATGELTRYGRRVPLQDQPARLLTHLATHHGELVTRETLQHLLWPEGTFVEFSSGLNVSISKIRNALGDAAAHPRFIETLPKRGYRFIAPVIPDAAPAADATVLVRLWRRWFAPHV
jgi:DNA-binding winged helix-turn-helix (wHTH) protein